MLLFLDLKSFLFQLITSRLVFQKGQGLHILKIEESNHGDDEGKPVRTLEWDIVKAIATEGIYTIELNRLNYRGCLTNSRCDFFLVKVKSGEKSKNEYYTVEFD